MTDTKDTPRLDGSEIAIVGMSCRLPGATTLEAFWRNLVDGVESLTELTAEDLRRSGLDPAVLDDPDYVARASVLDDVESFDGKFFGYTPLESKLMDPQHRLFLECAWEVLEQGGYNPWAYPRPVGVFTGAKTNTYLFSIVNDQELFRSLDSFQIALGNDLASMATRISYKLDLRGPSYALHTACSTSLVAVHLAVQSLLFGECDMAVAGGASINVPQKKGYRYQKGGILSPDGRCRTFDADAAGSNFGNGVGAVLLKRMDDAIADGDHIYAMIRGSAANNDGAAKASYTAPGVEGQTSVLIEAMAAAGVDAETISYIEAHGTATDLGDSIEMLALDNAFKASTDKKGFCAIGSVKTNLGHLETAAGVAGLIKTALALENETLPPSLHFEEPNPKIDFDNSPFYVQSELGEWTRGETPRRAGVSSFGIGSTNAHVILEEAPPLPAGDPARPGQLLLLSAKTETALETMTKNLASHLAERREAGEAPEPADVAFTLQVGRQSFDHRRALVARDFDDALELLEELPAERVFTHAPERTDRPVAFLLPGLGDHYVDMGRGLYETEPVFRAELDRCAELLEPVLGLDLREALFSEESEDAADGSSTKKLDMRKMLGRGGGAAATGPLSKTSVAHPALFAVEWALARLLGSWGIQPKALIGYSLSEYVAAALAGVMDLEDALKLVAERAKLVDDLEPGAMLAVPLPEAELTDRLEEHGLSLAVVNGPALCVVSGPVDGVEALEAELAEAEVLTRRLQNERAFHSHMMEPAAEGLAELARGMDLRAPEIPYVSNVTGTWITPEEAADPEYWARHLVQTVRFAEGVETLLEDEDRIYLEIGPGQNLASFVKQHPACGADAARSIFATLRNAYGGEDDRELLLTTLGKLWLSGQSVDWQGFYGDERRLRVPLPTYPFERERHWVEPPSQVDGVATAAGTAGRRVTLDKQENLADWFYEPTWTEAPLEETTLSPGGGLVVFADEAGLGDRLVESLREQGHDVARVRLGEAFETAGAGEYAMPPADPAAYDRLVAEVGERRAIVHLWGVAPRPEGEDAGNDESYARAQDRGFYSLIHLAQALGKVGASEPVRLQVVTAGVQRLSGDEEIVPERATVLGPARVIPQEFPVLTCGAVDVPLPPAEGYDDAAAAELARALTAELTVPADHELVALRGGVRWEQDFEPRVLEPVGGDAEDDDALPGLLQEEGVYLLSGGLGGMGLEVAEHLARTAGAKLVLTRRSSFPDRESWDDWLGVHGDDDKVSKKIHRLRQIEAAGGEVLALSADATSEDAMREAVKATLERFGRLDGVFHLAGVPGGGILQLKTREAAEKILAPKVQGARVLRRVLADISEEAAPRFVLMFSSIASVLGEFGQADYCGANAFLDALAQAERSHDEESQPRFLTVDWDIWRDVGLAVETEVPEHLKAWRAEMLEQAMSPAEGVEALDRILDAARPQTVVSAQDLHGRIELGKSFTGESFLEELAKAQGLPAGAAQDAAGTGSAAAERRVLGTGFVAARGATERTIAGVWARVLGVDEVGVNDNFFDLGGNSLIGLQLVSEMSKELGVQIPPVTLFEHPSVAALTAHLSPDEAADGAVESLRSKVETRRRRLKEGLKEGTGFSEDDRSIAVVAMTGRFPGAESVEELWDNLAAGRESIKFFTDEELDAAGIDPEVYRNPKYVRAGAVLEDIEWFDAGLFGYSPREAEVMDPQHRVFLECAWEALERAGTDPATYPGKIGVFAGSNLSTYLLQMHADPDVQASVNMLQAILGNDKDSLTTTVSYKLDLKGPSIAVQTFCSTSLVAVHMAMQSLRSGECDMAMAGGIRIVTPVNQGYLFEEGGIAPSDGHSRSFDADADGSVLGNGVGIVVLKRLADAVDDGDPILAVLKGSAINNDGSLKAGYTAPSVTGQAEAVAAAYEDAGVGPETISYLEAHGSATELGDPIEVTALTQAFRRFTDETVYCPIGSVKSNFGHLDRAAGVTGLIKTVLSLEHGQIPPTLHFETPNPQIDFEHSPFYVATELADWTSDNGPRRAGVNSLGMGGTNVHVVVEEPPAREGGGESRDWQLLTLSARTQTALDAATENLAAHLAAHPGEDLADVAFTLRTGRRDQEWRRAVVARDAEDAQRVLAGDEPARRMSALAGDAEPRVVFLFPGLGGQYLGMARGLYDAEPTFRETVDRCAGILEDHLDVDLREVIWPDDGDSGNPEDAQEDGQEEMNLRKMLGRDGGDDGEDSEAAQRLNRTRYTQPALFVIQYALATLWSSWGVKPEALVGYSLGEYVAAAVAGVLSLEDALALVVERARRIDELEEGALLAVALAEDDLRPRLGAAEEELSLMAVNGPEQCVVSGPVDAVEAFEEGLQADDVACRRLPATHAFHSSMMEPLYDGLVELTESVDQNPPRIPVLSNLTGTWLTEEDATDTTYWARHMCQPVRFSRAVEELLAEPGRILVEVGPGQTLASLVLQHPASAELESPPPVVSSLRHSYENRADQAHLLAALGKLWLAGLEIDEESFWADERRLKVLLPTYPFERQRYWIDARPPGASDRLDRGRRLPAADGTVRLYVPGFRRTAPRPLDLEVSGNWLVFVDDVGVGDALADRLETAGARVTRVRAGDEMRPLADGGYALNPVDADEYGRLLDAVDGDLRGIVHLWTVLPPDADDLDDETLLDRGLRSLQCLGEALRGTERELPLWVAGARLQDVRGGEEPEPGSAALLGAVRALRREVPGLEPVALDVDVPPGAGSNGGGPWLDRLVAQLAAEIASGDAPLVAFRGAHRWVPTVDVLPEPECETGEADGFFLVTDGSSDRGYPWARHLAERHGGRLALVEAPGFPDRDEWDEWLEGDEAGGLVSRRIRRLRELEELGAEIDVAALDETDRDALSGFLDRMEERHGMLAGVVHVAGLEGAEPELAAVHAWAEVLESRQPTFRLLVSPAAIPEAVAGPEDGAVGFALDAFAARRQASGETWTSVAWDLAATGDEGDATSVATARVVAAATLPQVVVTTRVLPGAWHRLDAVATDAAAQTAEDGGKVGYYARPSLQVEFVAPETETQEIIARAWRDLLGVDQVGIHDNFLDLGGDSLLATRLISRLRDVLDLDLPIRLVFEAATVAELAEVVEVKRAEQEEEEIAELVSMLDEMSDEEIEAELARKREALEQEV